MRRHYLTPLFREWVEILEGLTHFAPTTLTSSQEFSDGQFSKIQLFFGHQENISAILLELVDDQAAQKIRELYLNMKGDASKVKSQDEYDQFEEQVIEEYPLAHVGYGANILFELLVNNDRLGIFYFFVIKLLLISRTTVNTNDF
jgi:hypothetical protein